MFKLCEREKFELMPCKLVVNALAHCITLLDNNYWKRNKCKIILDFDRK